MIGTGVNLTAKPIRELGRSAALMQLCRNTGTIAANAGRTMWRNPAALSYNALPLSSLVLVTSRILISHFSAHKAKGTSDGPYRFREAVRTTIREAMGWCFSFAVLRGIESFIKRKLRGHFGVAQPSSIFSHFKKAVIKAWHGVRHTPDAPADPTLVQHFEFKNHAAFEKLRPRLEKWLPKLKGEAPEDVVKGIIRWTPPVVASMFAISLGGYALERFTRDYSDKVVNVISRYFNKGTADQPSPSARPKTEPDNGFAGYYGDVLHKRMARSPFGAPAAQPFTSPFSTNR